VYVTDERPQQEIDLPSFDHRTEFESGGSVNENASNKISGSSKDSQNAIDDDPSSISTKPKVLPPPKIEQPVLPPPKVEQPKPEVKPVRLPVQQAEVWMPLSLLVSLSNYFEAEIHFIVNL